MPDMRKYIEEKCSLAQTYADDGAYGSAARVLRDLAVRVQTHADEVNRKLLIASKKGKADA